MLEGQGPREPELMMIQKLKRYAKLVLPAQAWPFLRWATDLNGRWSQIKALLQGRKASFLRHDAQYRHADAIARAIAVTDDRYRSDAANSSELNLDVTIRSHPQLKVAVDVGSGIGWLSGWLAGRFERVISIEPSRAAVGIAQHIQRDRSDRITWRVGLAEDELSKLTLSAPALFVTGRVLTHLGDRSVNRILRSIDSIAPKGSVMVLSELWGEPHRERMWHIRSREWWAAAVGARWELEFLAHAVEAPGRFVGLRAICLLERGEAQSAPLSSHGETVKPTA